MLKIFSDLKPFFEDNYRRINVREYSRISQISPPSASKKLDYLHREGLLKKEIDKRYIYYFANHKSRVLVNLSRIYWMEELSRAGLIQELEKMYLSPVIILFGSFSKAEIHRESDIDIAIFSPTKKEANLSSFEKKLKRKIQIFLFKDQGHVENQGLLNNIFNGFIISGGW